MEPNAVAPLTQASEPVRTETTKDFDFETDEAEQQITADKLLGLAQMEIEESIKIRGSNPKEGVDACRQILKDYPNTAHAAKAQELLRRLPQRYKERFNITDEELGL
jgi:hypothetical protein